MRILGAGGLALASSVTAAMATGSVGSVENHLAREAENCTFATGIVNRILQRES